MKTIERLPAVCCAPGSPPLPEPVRCDLARRFRALGDPARVHIVNRLSAEEELCACVLQAELGLSQTTISHHLKVLREADLVESRKRGTWSYYRLRPVALGELAAVIGG